MRNRQRGNTLFFDLLKGYEKSSDFYTKFRNMACVPYGISGIAIILYTSDPL